jgi:GTPase SAR1 family protein
MKVLLNAAKKLHFDLSGPNREAARRIAELPPQSETWQPKQNLADIAQLWKDPAIQKTYERRDVEFQLNDSAAYFFDRAMNYANDAYVPDDQDVLRARVRTTGIDEAFFNFDDMYFRMVDVGGQRTERRKWIHCFEGVTSVLFCASLSEYDQRLREDSTQNRMIESLQLFGEICNSTWFRTSSIMLFLNKVDLFKEKIVQKDLKELFPEYTGGKKYEPAAKFLQERFGSENLQPNRPVYTHFTCAVDTGNIMFVFKAVKETIMNEMLNETFVM